MGQEDDHRGCSSVRSCNILPIVSSLTDVGPRFGLDDDELRTLGLDRANRIRTLRLLVVIAPHLRNLLDRLYASDGVTTQQAALLGVVRELGTPSLGAAARVLGTSHQNVKQLVAVLERKGLLRVAVDPSDRRVRRLETTAENRRYWARRDPDDHARLLTLFADLDAVEAEHLFRSLVRVFERLKALGESDAL
ncbi:MAG: MarR family transcriptional regulator [Myxococcales bacterium]|nr:MarR family transcriptional regulator [Myxococcales bacterium]